MDELQRLQEEVNALYIKTFKEYKDELNLSIPLIPRISKNYLNNRIVIVGQETNTWYRTNNNKGTDDLKDVFLKNIDKINEICLTKRYDHFIRYSAAKYGGNFWRFQRLLYEKNILEGNMIEDSDLSHCWLNIFAVEACRNKKDSDGRPTKNEYLGKQIIKIQKDLLFKVLLKLEPKIIIFLTGKSLDDYLKTVGINDVNCKWNSLDKNEVFSADNLSEIIISNVDNPLYNTKIIRAYHPSYFMGRINGYKKMKNKLKKKNINRTPSDYYTDLLYEKLRDIQSVHV